MVEISMYGSGEGPGAATPRAYSTNLQFGIHSSLPPSRSDTDESSATADETEFDPFAVLTLATEASITHIIDIMIATLFWGQAADKNLPYST